MTAKVLDGRALADKNLHQVADYISEVRKNTDLRAPCLAIVIVGNHDSSAVYVRNKIEACRRVGISPISIYMDENCTEEQLINVIHSLNDNFEVDAMIVQLPLPKHINPKIVLREIDPNKDADGFALKNQGGVMTNDDATTPPCTAIGVMDALEGIPLEGKHAVVVGRSNIVGRPAALYLLAADATVTIAHSRTPNLAEITRQADVLVVAVGKAKMITADMVKPGAVVVDVGINRDENGKLCGDVDFEAVKEVASFITPVPRGIGPLTVANLMINTYHLWLEHTGYSY